MSDIVERWMWESPGDIIERLVARSERTDRRGEEISNRKAAPKQRDRYYTQARRIHVKQLLMRVKR